MPRRSSIVKHSVDNDGLNVSPSQQLGLSRGYQTIVQVFPSTSAPSFNSFFIIDVKPQNAFLESVVVNFNTSALSGLVGGTPYMLPCSFWIQRIELVINDKVIDTVLGEIIWTQHQLFSLDDEERKIHNVAMGDYSSTATLNSLSTTAGSDWYVELFSLFKQSHIPLGVFPNHTLQLRIYTKSVADLCVLNGATGTPAMTINSCSAICKISKMAPQEIADFVSSIQRVPKAVRFNEVRYQIIAQSAGVSNGSYVLTSLGGARIDSLIFLIRPSGATTSNLITYTALSDFDILSGSGESLTGGQVVKSSRSLKLHSRYFTDTTFLIEGNAINNVYLFSFAHNPVITNNTGDGTDNYYRFQGNEQLRINYTTTLASAVEILVFAQCQSAIQITSSEITKIGLV